MWAILEGFKTHITYIHRWMVKSLSYYTADREKNYILLFVLWPYFRVKVAIITQIPCRNSLLKLLEILEACFSGMGKNDTYQLYLKYSWHKLKQERFQIDIWKTFSLLGQSSIERGFAFSILGVFFTCQEKGILCLSERGFTVLKISHLKCKCYEEK